MIIMDAPESTTSLQPLRSNLATEAETALDEDDEMMSLFELIMGNIDAVDAFESEKLVVTEAEGDSATTASTTGSEDSNCSQSANERRPRRNLQRRHRLETPYP